MPIIDELVSGGAAGILKGIGDAAIGIRTAITGEAPLDPTKRAEIEMQLAQIEQSATLAQLAVNQAEAASPSVFKGGWRPAVGWTCALAFFTQFVAMPLGTWFLSVFKGTVVPMPVLDMGVLMNLLLGMLGLGGLRTWEKIKGING